MTDTRDFVIRAMERSEVDYAVELARNEGWNPGVNDADVFYGTDPAGFLIGALDGKPVGCISAVAYEGRFGFIGFYIVDSAYRGQGYGLRLWQAAMQRLQGLNIGLDGVLARESDYIKSGFRRAHRNIRYERVSPGLPLLKDRSVIPLKSVPLDTITGYDRRCFPAGRDLFLRLWLSNPASYALGYLGKSDLKGYGVIRQCAAGFKIGPLFADDGVIAESLLSRLVDRIPAGEPVYLDVPEANPAAMALAGKYNMKEVFATCRMYNGGEPDIDLSKVFGVTSFELG